MTDTPSTATAAKTTPWNYDRPRLDLEHGWKGYPRELKSTLRYGGRSLLGRTSEPDLRFVIFGRGRSGSTLLVSLLDAHPSVSCQGEILRSRLLFPEAHRDRMLRMAPGTHRGFKLLSYQVTQVMGRSPDSGYLERMATDEGFRVLYIYRSNYLRLAVSNVYARLKGRFHSRGESGADRTMKYHFPPQDLIDWMEGAERRTEEESRLLEGVPHIDIEYERDLERPEQHERTVARACEHLKLEPEPVSSELRRTTPRELDDIISNVDEVRETIAASRFARFLQP